MHPIENILNITMSELKEMADVDTIVGKPFVTPNGQTIVPISKISFGFVSGGGEYHASAKAEKEVAAKEYPFAGGSSAGISISPVAFMVSGKEELRLMTVYNRTITDKILEQLPEMTKELRKMVGKKEEECKHGSKQENKMEEMGM
jgi:sporulation protein YtfJ